MLPDVGAGSEPLTHIWWIACAVLFVFTVLSSCVQFWMGRHFSKRDDRDAIQDVRLQRMDEKIRDLEIEERERQIAHNERMHRMREEIIQCQKASCQAIATCVSREEHHGDLIRLENKTLASHKEVMEAIVGVHDRIDAILNPGGANG